MKKLAFSTIVLLLASICATAQSGRRTKPTPTPVPSSVPASDDADYSESKPTGGPTYSHKRSQQPTQVSVQPKPDNTVTEVGGDDVIKVETSLVTIPVSVYERSGVYVSGLRRNDFKIFEDGKEQDIAYFGTNEVPFSVVLLIDVSGSTGDKIRQIQSAALDFIGDLRPNDKVMVVEFDMTVHTLCDFTSDRATLEKAVRKVGSGGGTALYTAVDTVLTKKFKGIEGRKAVVLFTDGVECSFLGRHDYDDTLALAEESDAVIYSVYYNTYFDSRGIGGSSGPMSGIPDISKRNTTAQCDTAEEYARGRAYLEELGRLTGGKMFRADSTSGGMSAAFEGIANELGNQYTIGYYSNEPGKNGDRKQIKVRVNRTGVAVRARDNYIVGQTPSKPPSAGK